VKPAPFELIRPETVEDAVAFKSGYGADASVLAGGQSLVPMLNFRLARPAALVDLGPVPGLDGIRLEDGLIHVGAMVRQTALEQSEVAVAACPVLSQALHHVAHPVIRNRGTVGGTIAHADASAELPTVLVALHGSVAAAGPQGSRTVSARELFDFHLTTSLEPDEILTEVRFPVLARGAGSAFVEVARRHGDYALAGVCAIVELDDDSRIAAARLAYCGDARRGDGGRGRPGRRAARGRRIRRGGRARDRLRRRHRRGTGLHRLSQATRAHADASCARRGLPPRVYEQGGVMEIHQHDPAGAELRVDLDRFEEPIVDVTLVVNGEPVTRNAPVRRLLSDFIRHDLGLKGTHVGCEHGVCGCCTVMVDGTTARSCLLLAAQCEGSHVTTVEGLSPPGGALSVVQQAFRDAHGLQCGFCTPGFIVTVTAFLEGARGRTDFTDLEIREALAGNLCRCTGYQGIVAARGRGAPP
jgi:xanthine dehydrogenase iron-sulfur cluster and FAD-binding subunit A